MDQRSLLYDARFLESYAGAIVTDPATAIVELVANCWDAYATQVEIAWPAAKSGRQFRIKDNGHGMKHSPPHSTLPTDVPPKAK